MHDRFSAETEDYLTTRTRYLDWACRASLLTRSELHRVERHSLATGLLAKVRGFRDALHTVFSARIDGTCPPDDVGRLLDQWVHRAWRSLRVDVTAPSCLGWRTEAVDDRLPLMRIALSALDLLEYDAPTRLKRCAAAGRCGWLFYDDSRSNTRRWCSMDTCGVAAKMRRYRAAEPWSK